MNANTPFSGNEILMSDGCLLVVKTDLNGKITYCNDEFVRISGFSRSELLGRNHSEVRHPDIPSELFEDLSKTVAKGYPWKGMIKSRCKHGGYFWSEANITAIFKNGRSYEYMIVQYAPSRQQIHEASEMYRAVNSGQRRITSRSKYAAWVTMFNSIPFWKQLVTLLVVLTLPSFGLFALLVAEQHYTASAGLSVFILILGAMGLGLVVRVKRVLEQITHALYRLTDGEFRNSIALDVNGDLGDLLRALQGMQVRLNFDLDDARTQALIANRIKQGLDNVETNVILTDADYNIIYLNDSVIRMFRNAEDDIRQQLPNFDVNALLGANIDIFHKDSSHQRKVLDQLEGTLKSTLHIGGHYMNIIANPVKGNNGERIGTVVEWQDRTHELQIEAEIEKIVDAVKQGDLAGRLQQEGKDGFFATLSEKINELADTIDSVVIDMQRVVAGMAAGDLSVKITNGYEGNFAAIKADINSTQDKLAEVFGQIRQAAKFIEGSSREIASGNNNLSQRADQQASSLQQTAASMEQLTSTVQNNADNAQQANQVASIAEELAGKGGDVVSRAISAMNEINTSSSKIAEIIGVIDEIAFQTNLLALNASVEAARAGEQGRGFSVVATEVRNLAQRSATAAKETKELIQTSVEKVRVGTDLVNQSGETLSEIVDGVKKVGNFIAEIAAASQQQSSGIQQVSCAVSQMDELTQQNAALAEKTSAASVSMAEQSHKMMQLLAFFNCSEGAGSQATDRENSASIPRDHADKPVEHGAHSNQGKLHGLQQHLLVDEQEWEEF